MEVQRHLILVLAVCLAACAHHTPRLTEPDLPDGDAVVARDAASTLQVGARSTRVRTRALALAALASTDDTGRWALAGIADPSLVVQREVVLALAARDLPREPQVVEWLKVALERRGLGVEAQYWAALALQQTPPAGEGVALASDDGLAQVVRTGLWVADGASLHRLAHAAPEAALTEALVAVLDGDEPHVAVAAAVALACRGASAGQDLLRREMRDPAGAVDVARLAMGCGVPVKLPGAAGTLAGLSATTSTGQLRAVATSEAPEWRAIAARWVGPAGVLDLWRAAMADEDARVRVQACLHAPSPLSASDAALLEAALGDLREEVRVAAAVAIERAG